MLAPQFDLGDSILGVGVFWGLNQVELREGLGGWDFLIIFAVDVGCGCNFDWNNN